MTACVETTARCELLPWDTEFFGCRIARVRGDTLNDSQAEQIDEWCQREAIQCLYFLSRADHPETIAMAERHGFGLVDIRVTFERKFPPLPAQFHSQAPIRPARLEDIPPLQEIARTAHRDTRFFSDHLFPQSAAEELYSTWIRLECEGRAQRVFVAASPADRAVGYVSCHFDPERGIGQIGLVGVSAQARGRGLGRSLVLYALEWLADQGAREVTVVTQGKNAPAQRLYQRCGFLTQDIHLWYHKWYPA